MLLFVKGFDEYIKLTIQFFLLFFILPHIHWDPFKEVKKNLGSAYGT